MNKIFKEVSSNSNDLSALSVPTLFNLSPFNKKRVEVSFTAEKVSVDGGLLLLKETADQTGLIKRLASLIPDNRNQSYVQHSIETLLSQRVFQIAAGYEDANDCNQLKDDPILKLCAGQMPETDESLASQPTMSRFENQLSRSALYKMALCFADHFVSTYASEPSVIIIDCDDTESITHGQQQYALFNGYYGENCYMPLHIYEGMSGKLITTILKPGRRSKNINVYAIVKRVIEHLRKSWKNTTIIVRGDSHFCCKELMDWTHGQNKVHFITGLTGNNILDTLSETTIKSAEGEYNKYGKPVKVYHSFSYKAASWENKQRVIVKVEVNSMGINTRYIVTDLIKFRTKELYEKGYCARGNMELRIKDHKLYLRSDRMSCSSFLANQMRLFLHSTAYILIHTLQKEVLKGTEYANVTMKTIQLRIIKVAARVKELKTMIRIEFPTDFPLKHIFQKCLGIFEVLRC
jgi:hypothetical protein